MYAGGSFLIIVADLVMNNSICVCGHDHVIVMHDLIIHYKLLLVIYVKSVSQLIINTLDMLSPKLYLILVFLTQWNGGLNAGKVKLGYYVTDTFTIY